jgi:chemotaxis protein CheD
MKGCMGTSGTGGGERLLATRSIQPGRFEVPGVVFATPPLGSCVAVFLRDEAQAVTGCLCFALPDSRLDRARARANPAIFADTGIEAAVEAMAAAGAVKSGIAVTLVGGAATLDGAGSSRAGPRNAQAARRTLSKLGIGIVREETGGSHDLAAVFEADAGRFTVLRSGGLEGRV